MLWKKPRELVSTKSLVIRETKLERNKFLLKYWKDNLINSRFNASRDFEASANNGDYSEELDLSTRVLLETFNTRDGVRPYPYEIIVRHKYPFRRDNRTLEEKVLIANINTAKEADQSCF